MEIIRLGSCGSTNSFLREHAAEFPSLTLVTAREQTAGRGQRGNTWESQPGKNLTVSMLWKPEGFAARRQFAVSEAVSLAVADTLEEFGIEAKVKWPNDIYVGDRKICGILIEHSVAGRNIESTVAGIGLNVNQREFFSDAPNPVSMLQSSGREHDLEAVLALLCRRLEERLQEVDGEGLHSEYMTRLWRGDAQFHPFRDTATGTAFRAMITAVDPDGILHLLTDRFEERTYAFKEVSFTL